MKRTNLVRRIQFNQLVVCCRRNCFADVCGLPQVNQLDAQVAQSVETVGTLYVMKSRPLQNVIVDSRFKSKDAAAQRREDLFSQVRNASGSPERTV